MLGRGYLPKELPTPFTSRSFAVSVTASGARALAGVRSWGRLTAHTLARPGMTGRVLGIPSPAHFYKLADHVQAHWSTLDANIQKSTLSLTKPTNDPSGRRALVPAHELKRIEARAEHRARARYLVEVDVSEFYRSVYTHALDWAVRGKAIAKAATGATTGLGPTLDRYSRNAQGGQTVGIPIGPDTSLVLGELLLAQVDEELLTGPRARWLHGFRYYDDYELHTWSRQQADQALADLQRILAEWQLAVNPYKMRIVELPHPIEEEWLSTLKRIELRSHSSQERSGLNALFDDAFRLARRFPRDAVISYALGHFVTRDLAERRRVQKANWPHFEKLLLQACLGEPGVLPRALVLLNWARLRGWPMERGTVSDALNAMLLENAARGHSSEVAWALWASIALASRVSGVAARAVSGMTDDVVALTALHAASVGVIRRLDTSAWAGLMTPSSLSGEHWLLAYEAHEQGWLPPAGGVDYIAADPVFAQLRSDNVRFYDTAASLPPLPAPKPRPTTIAGTLTAAAYLIATASEEEREEEYE